MINPVQSLLNIKFRNKLVLMCVMAIVPVTIGSLFLLFNLADTIKVNTANETISTADSLRTRLNDTIVTISNISDRVSKNEKVNELLSGKFSSSDEYYDFYLKNDVVSEFLDAYPQIDGIKFYIEDRKFAGGKDYCFADGEVQKTYWYKDTKTSKASKWQVIADENGENYHLCRVSPMNDGNGRFCGVMVISADPKIYADIAGGTSYGTVFCVSQGIVFYSSMTSVSEGTVISDTDIQFRNGASGSEQLESGKSRLERKGYTVVSYFDYNNTGNLFQVYVVKPFSIFGRETSSVIFIYIWYIFLCVILSVLITILFSSVFSRRIQFLKSQMNKVASGSFELVDDIRGEDEIYELYEDLKKMVDSMQALINEAYESKIQSESFKLNQMEAEFKALASQINPHFLYNTLETIRMKAYVNNDKETADLVKKLGKFMRRCLEVKDGMVTLESELEFTKSYLELQSARFGDRVAYSIYCEVARDYKILPLIIQPIVENAFVHGIEGEKANGKIDVKVYYRGEEVLIDVSDNGQGIPPDRMKELLAKLEKNDTSSGKSIGLTNVNKRIKMYHGEQYGLTVETHLGKGTTIRITLPRVTDENVMKRLPEKYSEISGKITAKKLINSTNMQNTAN